MMILLYLTMYLIAFRRFKLIFCMYLTPESLSHNSLFSSPNFIAFLVFLNFLIFLNGGL